VGRGKEVEWLRHLAAGVPDVLCKQLEGRVSGRYDPHRLFDLELPGLDRRIRRLPATSEVAKRLNA